MTEETTTAVQPEAPKPPRPVSRFTKRKSGGHKRPVRKSVAPAAEHAAAPQAPQGERPDRSKPVRVKYADRNRISFEGMDPDYVYRVINDKEGRIQKMQGFGYEFVESDKQIGDYRVAEGSKMGRAVSKPVGNGVNGYLMRIKKEFYDEDQAEKAKRVDATEAALKPQKAKEEYGPGLTNG